MATYNRVIVVGNLTRDVELRHTKSGTVVTDLGLAVNERVKRGNEYVEEPVFLDVTLWGKTAEVAQQYLNKGAPVLIEGRLKLDEWEDQQGQRRTKLKVVGERMQMLGGKPGGGQQQEGQPQQQPQYQQQGQQQPQYQQQGTPQACPSGGIGANDNPFV